MRCFVHLYLLGCIVGLCAAGGVKIILDAIKSGKLEEDDLSEARNLLGRIIQDPGIGLNANLY